MTDHTSHPRRTAAEQARLEEELKHTFETKIAFNHSLGLKVLSCDPDKPAMGFDMTPALVGHYYYGRLHGGVISAVLDTTAGLALMCTIGERFCDETTAQILDRFVRVGTIDLRIDYLRQGVGTRFVATAKVVRLGGRVGAVQMALHNDQDVLIATGAGAYVVS
jgi:uncharacterized protein (TIGR00369 family)